MTTAYPGPAEGDSRDDEIARNVEASYAARASLSNRVGRDVGPIALLRNPAVPAAPELLDAICQELALDWGRSATRFYLYMPFLHCPEKYVARLLEWHDRECYDSALQVLQGTIGELFPSPRRLPAEVVDTLLRDPVKLRFQGLTFLAKASRTDKALLERLRHTFALRGFDFDTLCCIAEERPKLYDLLASRPFLSAAECLGLLECQVPRSERVFVRPEIVPFSATIVEERAAASQELANAIESLMPGESNAEADAGCLIEQAGRHGCAVARMAHAAGDGPIHAVIVIPATPPEARRPNRSTARCGGHRERSRPRPESVYRVLSIIAPQAPEWNPYPRYLLPPDSPLRYMKPEK